MLGFFLDFVSAIKFLTIVPIDRAGRIRPRSIGCLVFWFPVVGLALGAVAWGVHAALAGRLPPSVVACMCLLVYFVLTGALHLDGLADTLDGALGGHTRERRLEIMRDSRIGTFGVLGIVFACGIRWAALTATDSRSIPAALLLMPAVGRWMQVVGMTLWPYARRKGGTGALFVNQTRPFHLAAPTCAAIVLVLSIGGHLLPALVIAEAAGILWALFVASRVGGMTGDTLGSTSEVSEVAFLVACSWLAPCP